MIKDARSLVELKQIEKPFLVSTAGNDGANMTPPANNNDTSTRPSDELVWEESQSKKSRIQTKEECILVFDIEIAFKTFLRSY